MRRAKTALVNGLLLIVALVVGAALSEVGLRLFYPQPMGVWHHDEAGLALHWPGLVTYLPQFGRTVSFNSVGMRDREHAAKKPEGVFRILVLGDSFMEALQVPYEKSFPGLLERALDRRDGKRVEIVNASVSGWGTDDELQYLKAYGMQWNPDLILVAMTLHNDISDNLRERFHTTQNGALVEQSRERASFLQYKVVQLKGFLATRSHAFQLLARSRRAGEMRVEAGQLASHVTDLFTERADRSAMRGIELTSLLLARMQAMALAEGSRLTLVLLPLRVQLSGEGFEDLAQAAPGSTRGFDRERPQRLMTQVASRTGIPVIDLLPEFRAWTAGGGAGLFLERDGHWNERGHRLAVEIVAREMMARGLDE